jgi:hypothetical protein
MHTLNHAQLGQAIAADRIRSVPRVTSERRRLRRRTVIRTAVGSTTL